MNKIIFYGRILLAFIICYGVVLYLCTWLLPNNVQKPRKANPQEKELLSKLDTIESIMNYELDSIIDKLIIVESTDGDTLTLGDYRDGVPMAYGFLQIWDICVQDVNRLYGTYYQHTDAFNPYHARNICSKYLEEGIHRFYMRYGYYPSEGQIARMWNGGIYSGYKSEKTLKYLRKV